MNEYLNSNLDSLVKKVFDEGVEKGKNDAQMIVASAKQEAEELLKKANQQTAILKKNTFEEINHLQENVRKELKIAVQQSISSAKNELAVIIDNKITFPEINPALTDNEFFQKMIITVLQKWDPANEKLHFELLLNESDEVQLRELLKQRIKEILAVEVEIVIDNKIKSGFKIAVRDENYYVSFMDSDFEQFFKGYLHKKTLEWIYGGQQQ